MPTLGGGLAGPARDPVAAGSGEPTTGLGDPIYPATPTPRLATPVVTPIAAPVRAANEEEDVRSTTAYRRSLILSGVAGLVLAATGLTMMAMRRRRW